MEKNSRQNAKVKEWWLNSLKTRTKVMATRPMRPTSLRRQTRPTRHTQDKDNATWVETDNQSLTTQIRKIQNGWWLTIYKNKWRTEKREKWYLLEGRKGRSGWGHHPYTLLTEIWDLRFETNRHNAVWSVLKRSMYVHIFLFFSFFVCLVIIQKMIRRA